MLAMGGVTWIEGPGKAWSISYDPQLYYWCLPFKVYAVQAVEAGHVHERGNLVLFNRPLNVEQFTEEFDLIKIVAAVAGDEWRVEDEQVWINGQLWGGIHLTDAVAMEDRVENGASIVPEGHVLVMGTTPSSFDSRYWGPLPIEKIAGRAYALF